jgi:hypothetical protein
MKLVSDSGLWSTGSLVAPTPVLAVLEVSGAVLSWTVDEPTAAPQITFTDLRQADWLWRVFGESGHSAVASALEGPGPHEGQAVELNGVDVMPGSLDPLRRLAFGHWLRRWWPVSHRDGIAALDGALLDAEIALLTSALQDYFTDDTFDSDVADMLRPHAAALNAHVQQGDPRVIDMVERCAELAEDAGIVIEGHAAVGRRDDFALAAGGDAGRQGPATVASGVDSISWGGVPPGVFDAAEGTVAWAVEAAGGAVTAQVRAELSGLGSPNGIPVRLQSGPFSGEGVLGADGFASFPVGDQSGQITDSAAWNHDWESTRVTVGADVEESARTRNRVREFVRGRLAVPGDDAFLAEVLAAESDY